MAFLKLSLSTSRVTITPCLAMSWSFASSPSRLILRWNLATSMAVFTVSCWSSLGMALKAFGLIRNGEGEYTCWVSEKYFWPASQSLEL